CRDSSHGSRAQESHEKGPTEGRETGLSDVLPAVTKTASASAFPNRDESAILLRNLNLTTVPGGGHGNRSYIRRDVSSQGYAPDSRLLDARAHARARDPCDALAHGHSVVLEDRAARQAEERRLRGADYAARGAHESRQAKPAGERRNQRHAA